MNAVLNASPDIFGVRVAIANNGFIITADQGHLFRQLDQPMEMITNEPQEEIRDRGVWIESTAEAAAQRVKTILEKIPMTNLQKA